MHGIQTNWSGMPLLSSRLYQWEVLFIFCYLDSSNQFTCIGTYIRAAMSLKLKSRPRSLKKKSIASSHLPTLHRHFSKSGVAHHEVIDADSMSGTNELIANAFKDLKNDSVKSDESTAIDLPVVQARELTNGERECFILTEGESERNLPTTDGPLILKEDGHSSVYSPEQMLLKTPPGMQQLTLGRNSASSSSIDSGVYSLRGSKRPSFESPSPVDFMQSNIILRQRSRTTPSKLSTPTVSIDDTTTKRKTSRLSVDEEAFAELLQAATKLVLDVHPQSERTGLHNNNLYLKNSLQYFKRRKSEWDLTGLGWKPQHEKLSRKKSAEPILQRIPAKASTSDLRKKSSACIICERNKRVNDNVCSSVLIKTSMVRTMQERRRFSEVLKVLKGVFCPRV